MSEIKDRSIKEALAPSKFVVCFSHQNGVDILEDILEDISCIIYKLVMFLRYKTYC